MRCAGILVASRGSSTSSTAAFLEQRRYITRLYTSYFAGRLYPTQMVLPKARLPVGVTATSARSGAKNASAATREGAAGSAANTETEGVSWKQVDNTDLVHTNMQRAGRELTEQVPARPYVPLEEVAKIELQGDYLSEGGLHQEALEHYGVVAKAYDIAYPESHSQRVGIRIKLAGALRRTGRLESSKAIVEVALAMLDASQAPSLELLVEALLELGLSKEALDETDAGAVWEEALAVVEQYHNFGDSHRMLRLLPRLSRRFNLNYEEKFLYYSPFDYDRVFAIVDQCLEHAEQFYRTKCDSEGVIRVLQHRKELIDRKFFNMRDFAGRIHTMRGHWMRRANVLTNAPTPEELLRYSPTVHQVHRDFKYELNAPIGREKEVQQGVNRVVQDMGNPYRRRGVQSQRMMRDADYNFARYTRAREFSD